jgi:DUF4097 and DUF4098 domain-containing protein YvlB
MIRRPSKAPHQTERQNANGSASLGGSVALPRSAWRENVTRSHEIRRVTFSKLTVTALSVVAALLCGGSAVAQTRDTSEQQPPIQARPGGPEGAPKTDQTIDVAKGTRLVLTNNAGEVVVRSWDRDQVRIVASHSGREQVDVQTTDMTLRIRARAARGPSGLVDYQLTVPRWMAVNLSGTYLEATIEGTAAEVTVETVHGNAKVVGGGGAVSLRSVEGIITVDKASGRVQATTVNEGIRVSNVTGEITAETTNGDIVIENAQSSNLEASTVNGDVTFNGTIRDSGSYRLTTHGGDIRIGLGGAKNATVFVRTFQGDFSADFPIQLPEGQSSRGGSKRFNFTLGSGSARIEAQSFNGDIVLARGTILSQEEERRRRREGRTPTATPSPTPSPTPTPKKPPGDLDVLFDKFDKDFGPAFEKSFEKSFDKAFGKDFEVEFEKNFEKNFDKDFEKAFDFKFDKDFDRKIEKQIEQSFKSLTRPPGIK